MIHDIATRCVWKEISPITHAIAELYSSYKDGFLLTRGALEDQPAWYISAMQIMKGAMNRQEHERIKRMKEGAEIKQ